MTNTQKERYGKLGTSVVKALNTRHFEAYYCPDAPSALEKLLELIPSQDTVAWGGSQTLSQIGAQEQLRARGQALIDRDTAQTPEERSAMMRRALTADTFLMSSNAITIDGELVNIDGRANRVSLLCWGPQNVIVIAGMNKITSDVESAIQRVRDAAAPPNTVRLNKNTPCAQTGRCGNCYSPDCICSQIVITRRSSTPKRIKVILVGEELGY